MAVHDTPGPVHLRLRLTAGRADVAIAAGETTTVELHPISGDAATAAIEETDERLERRPDGSYDLLVEVPQVGRLRRFGFGGGEPSIAVRVTAPEGSSLDVDGAAVDVAASGTLSGLTAKTMSGDVRAGDVDGDVRVKTMSGDVELRAVAGRIEVSTASGDVDIVAAGGETRLKSMSGELRLGTTAASLDASSMSGDIRVDSLARGEASLKSMSGDVTAGVVPGTRVWLDLSTLSGEASSELDDDAAGEAGGGVQLTLRASSKSGDVHVRRAAAPAAT